MLNFIDRYPIAFILHILMLLCIWGQFQDSKKCDNNYWKLFEENKKQRDELAILKYDLRINYEKIVRN